jgi:hypothetical protein
VVPHRPPALHHSMPSVPTMNRSERGPRHQRRVTMTARPGLATTPSPGLTAGSCEGSNALSATGSSAADPWFVRRARGWASLRTSGLPLRCGAWYPVLCESDDEVVVVVHRHPMAVARSSLELREHRPARWTVVLPHGNDPYGVCPSCAERVPLPRERAAGTGLSCPRCRNTFALNMPSGLAPGTFSTGAAGGATGY